MATIREWLEATGGMDRVVNDLALASALDLECNPVFASTSGTGALQGSCGGDILMRLYRHPVSAYRVYLVRDDSEGEKWTAHERALGNDSPPPSRPRPFAVLRLVHSC